MPPRGNKVVRQMIRPSSPVAERSSRFNSPHAVEVGGAASHFQDAGQPWEALQQPAQGGLLQLVSPLAFRCLLPGFIVGGDPFVEDFSTGHDLMAPRATGKPFGSAQGRHWRR